MIRTKRVSSVTGVGRRRHFLVLISSLCAGNLRFTQDLCRNISYNNINLLKNDKIILTFDFCGVTMTVRG